MNDKLIEKLKKLLALSGNNPSAAEAELAMQKAQALALEHGIDLALIGNSNNDTDDEVIKESVEMGARLPTVNTYVGSIINEFFDIRLILSGNRTFGRSIIFVGKREAINTAKYIYTWLSETMIRCWKRYYEKTPGITLNHKQGYLLGFFQGLREKLIRNKKEVEDRRLPTDEDKSKYALVRVDLNKKLESFIEDEFDDLRKTPRKRVNIYSESYGQGIADGHNCNVAKGGIENKSPVAVLA